MRIRAVLLASGGALFLALVALMVALGRVDWVERAEGVLARKGCPSEVGRLRGFTWKGAARLGPVRLCRQGEGYLAEAEELVVRPSFRSLLAGRARPARVLLRR